MIQFFFIRISSNIKQGTITFPISFNTLDIGLPCGFTTRSNTSYTSSNITIHVETNTEAHWYSTDSWPWFYVLFIGIS